MPNVRDFVNITATIDTAMDRVFEWGYPAIVGEQAVVEGAYTHPETNRDVIKTYYSADTVLSEQGDGTLYKAAVAAFSQGISKLYAIALSAAIPGTPTPEEIGQTLTLFKDHASEGKIQGICLAQIYDTPRLLKLKEFCDANDLIFVVTNQESGDPALAVPTIKADRETLASKNGSFVAHASTQFVGDVAAAALGRFMILKPWVTPFMKDVAIPVEEFFEPSDVRSLEDGYCNVLLKFDNKIRFSNGLTMSGTSPKFMDIVRMQYHVTRIIQDALIRLRINAEKIPYTPSGLETIKTTIASVLEGLVREGALHKYTVQMPLYASISNADKENRILNNVKVTCILAGDIQGFNIALSIQV